MQVCQSITERWRNFRVQHNRFDQTIGKVEHHCHSLMTTLVDAATIEGVVQNSPVEMQIRGIIAYSTKDSFKVKELLKEYDAVIVDCSLLNPLEKEEFSGQLARRLYELGTNFVPINENVLVCGNSYMDVSIYSKEQTKEQKPKEQKIYQIKDYQRRV